MPNFAVIRIQRGSQAAERSSSIRLVTASKKDAFVAEALVVELQRFKFNAFLIRNVIQFNRSEIGLASFRANACEFVGCVTDGVVSVRCGIWKSFYFYSL